MNINTNFDVVTYVAVVNELAENFFDISGEYAPHMGMLKSMCTFYNYCVTDSKYDEQIRSGLDVIEAVNILASDEDFIKEFDKATYPDRNIDRIDFATAYRNAKDIVDTKKNGIGYIADILKVAVDGLIEKIAPALTEENMSNIGRIAKGMTDGQNIPQAIVKEYIKSGRFKDIASKNVKSN